VEEYHSRYYVSVLINSCLPNGIIPVYVRGLFPRFRKNCTTVRNISRNNQHHGIRTQSHTDLISKTNFVSDHRSATSTSQHIAVPRNITPPSPSGTSKYVFPNRYSHHNAAHILGLSILDTYAPNRYVPSSVLYTALLLIP
jgi:hypothetical protein